MKKVKKILKEMGMLEEEVQTLLAKLYGNMCLASDNGELPVQLDSWFTDNIRQDFVDNLARYDQLESTLNTLESL